MSLYRKYRPQNFEDLKGQDHVKEVLQNALKQDRVSHAYLFTGPRGTGKTSSARILARALNCESDKEKAPCNECSLCQEALNDQLTDLIEIDAASHGLVDDARDLVEKARFMPTRAKNKVYIIDEVHMLSKSAFNALLKIVEEPPDHVYFILATTESHKVLETIRSRCQRFDFHLADEVLLKTVISGVCELEKVKPADEALELLSAHARGSFRDGLSLLEQVIGLGDFSADQVRETLGLSQAGVVQEFVKALFEQDLKTSLECIKNVHDQGHDLSEYCQDILVHLRELLLASSAQTCPQILKYIDAFLHAHEQLKSPVISQMPLELAVYSCIERDIVPVSQPVSTAPLKEKTEVASTQMVDEKIDNKDNTNNTNRDDVAPIESQIEPSVENTIENTGSFDKKVFFAEVKQASLRSLLKFSDLSYSDKTLMIKTRSGFEKNKLMEQDTYSYLLGILRQVIDPKATLKVEEGAAPLPEGVSSSDLESVF
ncbi:MAG: DNA polymerase III subunit gamma/tau [Candidatus Gracilibacteria bacterium]|nr:DNA polymerase III subunit gamma/tau [Candidatus Gracilibacteria bacterium]